MVVKIFRFGEYLIKIYDTKEELEQNPLTGFRSLCYNNLGKPIAIEVIGNDIKQCEKEWAFCHLINSINQTYKLVLEEVK